MNVLLIARFTLKEAVSRRLVLAAVALSAAFLLLYGVAFWFVYGFATAEAASPSNRSSPVFASTLLTILGLYAVNFLASLLALFLSVGAVSAELDTGTLLAVMARPLGRAEFVLGRWLAYVLMVATYVTAMVGSVLLMARWLADYEPGDPLRAIALMVLGSVLLTTLALLGSTAMPTIANGVIGFSLFGLAWLAGIVEWIGGGVGIPAMVNLGIAVSLLVPSDGLWRGASYYLLTPVMFALLPAGRQFVPFASGDPPAASFVVWAVGYVAACLVGAVVVFRRRDL